MSSLSSLLRKFASVTTQIATLESQRASLEKEILAAGRTKPRKARKRRLIAKRLAASTRGVIDAIHAAGSPVGRSEIGTALEISPAAAAKRLERAVELGLVERVGYGKYRLTSAATEALKP